ncbi:MAG: hypothetical protein JRG91_09780 [Deltaproteobacteria bacterium]|nr:hypothetical protein [Deltaproteobacteria bacterium]
MRVTTSILVGGLAAIVLACPRLAEAMSCIDHAWETMDVTLEGVTSGGEPVDPPPELKPLDQLLNSSSQGKSILFWEKENMGFAKFYALAETVEPTPGVASYIDAYSEWTLETGCHYEVSYTPILPGRYPFQEEHGSGGTTSAGVDDPVLIMPPDRETVTLEFKLAGVQYAARYKVTCAYFEWDGSKSCAITSSANSTPPPPPPVQPARSGCANCSVTGAPDLPAGSLALLVIVLSFAARRRSRR